MHLKLQEIHGDSDRGNGGEQHLKHLLSSFLPSFPSPQRPASRRNGAALAHGKAGLRHKLRREGNGPEEKLGDDVGEGTCLSRRACNLNRPYFAHFGAAAAPYFLTSSIEMLP